MSSIVYQVNLTSWWHTSSGLSSGTDANLVVIKNLERLPFIPGKTLKGLLREAASKINRLQPNMVTEEFITDVFGIGEDHGKAVLAESICFFGNAYLSQRLSENIIKESQQDLLYSNLASTEINSAGVAVDKSLRTIEVTIPLTLYANIEAFPNKEEKKYLQQLKYCMQWIKRLGLNRTRGLGRCEFKIIKPKADK
ncbi:MAG: RAMP superfamily CRISPR-associated protein [Bacteroidota bacterium]